MKSFALLAATLALPLLSTSANATLVAAWNFNTLVIPTASSPGNGGVPQTIAASTGAGTVDLTGFLGNVDDFAGTTLNTVSGDAAGPALCLLGGGPAAGPYPGNGGSITVAVSLAGLQDPVVTFATQKTATGFNTDQFSYSIDGGLTFINVGAAYAPAASFAVVTYDLSSIDALDNAPNVLFKITFDGDTSNAGNNRIDNLQVNTVPEPAAAALGALGLFGILRRRRA